MGSGSPRVSKKSTVPSARSSTVLLPCEDTIISEPCYCQVWITGVLRCSQLLRWFLSRNRMIFRSPFRYVKFLWFAISWDVDSSAAKLNTCRSRCNDHPWEHSTLYSALLCISETFFAALRPCRCKGSWATWGTIPPAVSALNYTASRSGRLTKCCSYSLKPCEFVVRQLDRICVRNKNRVGCELSIRMWLNVCPLDITAGSEVRFLTMFAVSPGVWVWTLFPTRHTFSVESIVQKLIVLKQVCLRYLSNLFH
jgi:hypothetical protein